MHFIKRRAQRRTKGHMPLRGSIRDSANRPARLSRCGSASPARVSAGGIRLFHHYALSGWNSCVLNLPHADLACSLHTSYANVNSGQRMNDKCVNSGRHGGLRPSMFDHKYRLCRCLWIPPKGALTRPTKNQFLKPRLRPEFSAGNSENRPRSLRLRRNFRSCVSPVTVPVRP